MKIMFMQDNQRDETIAFINRAMKRTYQCNAHPLPERVLIACEGNVLFGAIGFSEVESGLLPIEILYQIDATSFPGGVRPSEVQMIQFGRWVASTAHVGNILLYEAARYAFHRRYTWAVSEVKPQVERHFRHLGMPIMMLSGKLRRDRIPRDVLPYYDPPMPSPCIASVVVLQQVFGRRIVQKGIEYQTLGLEFM